MKNNNVGNFNLLHKYPSEFTCGMCKSLSNVFIPMSHSEKLPYHQEKFLEKFEHVPFVTIIEDLMKIAKTTKSGANKMNSNS